MSKRTLYLLVFASVCSTLGACFVGFVAGGLIGSFQTQMSHAYRQKYLLEELLAKHPKFKNVKPETNTIGSAELYGYVDTPGDLEELKKLIHDHFWEIAETNMLSSVDVGNRFAAPEVQKSH